LGSWITKLSTSQISAMAHRLDAEVGAFRNRPLDTGPYPIVWADALVVKVQEAGRTVNVHVLVVTGVNAEGYREILGVEVATSEDKAGWLACWRSLVARRLSEVVLVILRCPPGARLGDQRDPTQGHLAAVSHPLPAGSLGQGGQLTSSLCVATLVRTIFDQPDATEVTAQFQRVTWALAGKLPKVAWHLEQAREDLLAFRHFPEGALAPDLEYQPPRSA